MDVGQILDELESERSLAGDQLEVVERVDVRQAPLRDQLERLLVGLVPDRPVQHDLRPVPARRLDLGGVAFSAITTTARMPCSAAASATPCAWLPADEQITPARFSSSLRCANLFSGPRSLYEPVRWNDSALR